MVCRLLASPTAPPSAIRKQIPNEKKQPAAGVVYSTLNASKGSTDAARQAGTRLAISAVTPSSAVTPAKANGSSVVRPASRVSKMRETANAPPRPIATPMPQALAPPRKLSGPACYAKPRARFGCQSPACVVPLSRPSHRTHQRPPGFFVSAYIREKIRPLHKAIALKPLRGIP
jgi:hypothetical protein